MSTPIDLNELHDIPPVLKEVLEIVEQGSGKKITHPDCHTCTHRRSVPGSAHSECVSFEDPTSRLLLASGVLTWGGNGIPRVSSNIPIVGLHRIGVHGGWATWPIDFDPRWVLWCLSYEPRKE